MLMEVRVILSWGGALEHWSTGAEARMNGIGGFLCELAPLERTQPESLCQGIEVLDDTARLDLAGGLCEVPLGADRRDIAAALRQVGNVVDPGVESLPVSARGGRSALWAVLLEDLGVHYPDMVSICRASAEGWGPVRFHRIERSGPLALITVTDGRKCFTYSFDLDAGQSPLAVPVEIADSLSYPPDRPTQGVAKPPRSGHLGAWIGALVRGQRRALRRASSSPGVERAVGGVVACEKSIGPDGRIHLRCDRQRSETLTPVR
jgi:hypothetical protein